MKTTIWAAAIALLGAGAALAQDKKGEDPRRDFERRMRDLEERFRAEREKLEREFRDRLQPRKGGEEHHGGVEELVKRLMERVERLERRLDDRFGEFGRNFNFKEFREFMPRVMPRFEDRDFRFEFRRRGEDDEERRPAPKKKVEEPAEKKKKTEDEEPAPKKKLEKKVEEKKERSF